MKGILFGVGVGPGDPELMTIKAVRLIRENDIIALPGAKAEETVAYKIAEQAVPELAEKFLLPVPMPMTRDREEQARNHEAAAERIEKYLKQGENVVFLTLGDPTIYSTYLYVQKRVQQKGYETKLVSGIPSFCAAAARAGVSLCEWQEQLHIVPAVHLKEKSSEEEKTSEAERTSEAEKTSEAERTFLAQGFYELPGNYVLMKAGSRMQEIKDAIAQSGREVIMVENCGMPEEHVYYGVEKLPEQAGYYSLMIVKEGENRG